MSSCTHPEANKNGTPASPATALASIVLPVPGEPVSKMPLGSFPPSAANIVGSFRNCTTSCSSSLASSTPCTSLNLTGLCDCWASNSDCRGACLTRPEFSRRTARTVSVTGRSDVRQSRACKKEAYRRAHKRHRRRQRRRSAQTWATRLPWLRGRKKISVHGRRGVSRARTFADQDVDRIGAAACASAHRGSELGHIGGQRLARSATGHRGRDRLTGEDSFGDFVATRGHRRRRRVGCRKGRRRG